MRDSHLAASWPMRGRACPHCAHPGHLHTKRGHPDVDDPYQVALITNARRRFHNLNNWLQHKWSDVDSDIEKCGTGACDGTEELEHRPG